MDRLSKSGILLVLAVVGCQPADPPAQRDVPVVDRTRHSVDLDEIQFNTFKPNTPLIRLSDATDLLTVDLRDLIRPVTNPSYVPADQIRDLDLDDQVIGYTDGEQAWAFLVRVLNFREIVNGTFAGTPVVVTWCPLCLSAIVYDRRVDGRTLTFGNTSAVYESNMVMYDHETGSYWWQVAGRCVVGELNGRRLNPLPSILCSWSEWRQAHPQTLVLVPAEGLLAQHHRRDWPRYEREIDQGLFVYPVTKRSLDARLSPSTRVWLRGTGAEAKAIAIDQNQLSAHIANPDDSSPVKTSYTDPKNS